MTAWAFFGVNYLSEVNSRTRAACEIISASKMKRRDPRTIAMQQESNEIAWANCGLHPYVRWFEDIRLGKTASLGELYPLSQRHIKVPKKPRKSSAQWRKMA
jgi:hypothetical protein